MRGLTWGRIPRERLPLPGALELLDKLCATEPRVPAGVVLATGAAAAERSDDATLVPATCVLCMVAPRTIRFGCGHTCCCLPCARLLASRAASPAHAAHGACPACRELVAPAAWRRVPPIYEAMPASVEQAAAPAVSASEAATVTQTLTPSEAEGGDKK